MIQMARQLVEKPALLIHTRYGYLFIVIPALMRRLCRWVRILMVCLGELECGNRGRLHLGT